LRTPQELGVERAKGDRLASEAAAREAAQAKARAQVATLSGERNSLSALVGALKSQVEARGTELAAQLEAAALLARDRAAAEARAREAERAKSRLELDVAQLQEVRG
jgi:chromosome segregation ATPase